MATTATQFASRRRRRATAHSMGATATTPSFHRPHAAAFPSAAQSRKLAARVRWTCACERLSFATPRGARRGAQRAHSQPPTEQQSRSRSIPKKTSPVTVLPRGSICHVALSALVAASLRAARTTLLASATWHFPPLLLPTFILGTRAVTTLLRQALTTSSGHPARLPGSLQVRRARARTHRTRTRAAGGARGVPDVRAWRCGRSSGGGGLETAVGDGSSSPPLRRNILTGTSRLGRGDRGDAGRGRRARRTAGRSRRPLPRCASRCTLRRRRHSADNQGDGARKAGWSARPGWIFERRCAFHRLDVGVLAAHVCSCICTPLPRVAPSRRGRDNRSD